MRVICLKLFFFAANYSNILAGKVKIGSLHTKLKRYLQNIAEEIDKDVSSVIYKQGQATYTSTTDLNTEECEVG